MKSLILNEGYKSDKNSVLFEKGIGDKIFFKGKKFIDLSALFWKFIIWS